MRFVFVRLQAQGMSWTARADLLVCVTGNVHQTASGGFRSRRRIWVTICVSSARIETVLRSALSAHSIRAATRAEISSDSAVRALP